MSTLAAGCTAPIQPTASAKERLHPRFNEWYAYKSALDRQFVTALTFAAWLGSTERRERGYEVVFMPLPGAQLAPGWYKHSFAPGSGEMTRFGPFATEAQARTAKAVQS